MANLLRDLQYSCQSNRKTREGSNHPDRDAQFAHINATVKAARATRRTGDIGRYQRRRNWLAISRTAVVNCVPRVSPSRCGSTDFKIPELGKVAPYGVYDIAANHGSGQLSASTPILAPSPSEASAALVAEAQPSSLSTRLVAAGDHGGLCWQQRAAGEGYGNVSSGASPARPTYRR